jgi:hypothetical protein
MKFTDAGNHNFEQPPIGTEVARCIKVIDIGTQKGEYQGKVTFKRQVIIGWELPNALMTEGEYAGKPFGVSKFYTASLNEKANLRADLANWRGRDFTPEELTGFEARNILGKTCMLSLTANDKGRVRVTGVMAPPKGMQVPDAINSLTYFSLDEFAEASLEALSEGYQKMIKVSPEYQQIMQAKTNPPRKSGFDDMDDDIPF